MPYLPHCETLWQSWLRDSLKLSKSVAGVFELDHLPEPYLYFGDRRRALCWLTTNPGAGMKHQQRTMIQAGRSSVSPDGSYADAAMMLSVFYQTKLEGPARRRIEAMLRLSTASGYSGFLQVESFPFHSQSLPGKSRLMRHAAYDDLLRDYHRELRAFLKPKTVVSLSAVSTQMRLTPAIVHNTPWLSWQADLMGFNTTAPKIIPLVKKGSRVTSAFVFEQHSKGLKGFILMMGGNHLPSAENLRPVEELLRSAGG